MTAINYDPDGRPEITPELARAAEEMDCHIVNVVCDEPGAKVDDPGGVSFLAVVPYIPRAGDRILLQNGRLCEVQYVLFKVGQAEGATILVPNVVAVARQKGAGSDGASVP